MFDTSRCYRANWQDEIESAALYQGLAEAEPLPHLAEVYRKLAAVEEEHASLWASKLAAEGQPLPLRHLRWRIRTLIWLAQRFGPAFVLPTVGGLERMDSHDYATQPESHTTTLPAQERTHARVLQSILSQASGGIEGNTIAQLEGRHRASSGNALRAAVLGASDGLLSNFSLVMGMAGANTSGARCW